MRPSRGLLAVAATMSPLAFVLSHNLAYLLSAGDEVSVVLRATGHGAAWFDSVRAVIAVSALLGVAGIVRLIALWRAARRLERGTGRPAHTRWRGFGPLLLRTWLCLLLTTTLWFVLQENIERLAIGQAAPLLGVLLEGGPIGALAVIALVSLLTAIVGTLFRWGVAALMERISAARRATGRQRPAATRRPAGRRAHPSALLARHLGLRAPPPPLAA
jgi:hypothetical protein